MCWIASARRCPLLEVKRSSNAGPGMSSSDLWREQCMVVRFDSVVAFADGFLQGFNVGDLNMAPRILYHSSLLKCARMQRHAGSLDAQHLTKKFLGELQTVRAR